MTDVRVRVRRFDPAAGRRMQAYSVEVGEIASVLDVLRLIVADHDPTLSFRSACRVGMCGTCTIVIDGREGLACQTPVRDSMTLEPLRGLPVIKDLVVDPAPFFDRYQAIRPRGFGPAGPGHESESAAGDCITCGACLSACTMATINESYVGPAALFRALRLVEEESDDDARVRIRGLADSDGMYGCRGHLDCIDVCPKGLPLADAIHKLKRLAVSRTIGALVSR